MQRSIAVGRKVASWSNGHHHPPPELKELTDHLADNKLKSGDFLWETERPTANRPI